jgi:hypothetical protein
MTENKRDIGSRLVGSNHPTSHQRRLSTIQRRLTSLSQQPVPLVFKGLSSQMP